MSHIVPKKKCNMVSSRNGRDEINSSGTMLPPVINCYKKGTLSVIDRVFLCTEKYTTERNTVRNPRYANGNLRRKHRARMKAMGCECGICKGRLGPIRYDEPSDSKHPLSFVIDEIKPVSRWREFGYSSPEAAAQDWNNLQAAHYCCNAAKSNKVIAENVIGKEVKMNIKDGDW